MCVHNPTDVEPGSIYGSIVMPRLLPTASCPKCRGPMTRRTTVAGTIFACDTCDKDDPMKVADPWIKGELKPPS
jgi:hypothetical protein